MKRVQSDNLRWRCLSYRFLYLVRWIPLLAPIDSDTSSLFSIISYWKNQLVWRNRRDTHTFLSGAIYCRMTGKLTLYVSNVDILMKKKISPQNTLAEKENISVWKYWHVVSWEWQVSASSFQPSLQGRVSAWTMYSTIHPGSFRWWVWWYLLGSPWWWQITRD